VVGAHLTGQPLNHQLTDRGAVLQRVTATAPCYRFYALRTEPPKPGLVRVDPSDAAGASIEVEVWELDTEPFGSFVNEVPAPLAIGRVVLIDGSEAAGFVCEPIAVAGAEEITRLGGWRAYLSTLD
jgi:allophanate hydrolase